VSECIHGQRGAADDPSVCSVCHWHSLSALTRLRVVAGYWWHGYPARACLSLLRPS
jgi:hypothetical protein